MDTSSPGRPNDSRIMAKKLLLWEHDMRWTLPCDSTPLSRHRKSSAAGGSMGLTSGVELGQGFVDVIA